MNHIIKIKSGNRSVFFAGSKSQFLGVLKTRKISKALLMSEESANQHLSVINGLGLSAEIITAPDHIAGKEEPQKYAVGVSKHYGAKDGSGFGGLRQSPPAMCENCGGNAATCKGRHHSDGWHDLCRDCANDHDIDLVKSL